MSLKQEVSSASDTFRDSNPQLLMQLGWQVDGFSYKEIKAANYGVTEEFVLVAGLVTPVDALLLAVFEVAAVLLAVEEV